MSAQKLTEVIISFYRREYASFNFISSNFLKSFIIYIVVSNYTDIDIGQTLFFQLQLQFNAERISMKVLKKWLFISSDLLLLLLISACLPWQSVEEKIYNELEMIVQYEEDFAKLQDPLLKLEEEDHEIYNEIVAIGLSDQEKIHALAEKGIEVAEKRQDLLDQERESIVASATEFNKVSRLIKKIKDEELKSLAERLFSVMNQRYAVHELLYEEYTTGIQLDQALYRLLQKEDVSFTTLETQIDERNDVYRRLYSLNEQFNDLTEKYNELKGKFYRKAGIVNDQANS